MHILNILRRHYEKIIIFLSMFFSSLVLFTPSKCLAANNYVITLSEFNSESKAVAKEIKNYYNTYIESGSTCEVKVYSSYTEFTTIWNSIAKESNVGMIVINSHGNPNQITNVSKYNVSSLDCIDCDYLLLLGCNCGHEAYIFNNVAYSFLDKVTGVVIASDGTVESGTFNGWSLFTQTFTSLDDEYWEGYESSNSKARSTNSGWIVYERKTTTFLPVTGSTYTEEADFEYYLNFKELTIKKLLNYFLTGDAAVTPKKIK